MNNPYGNYKKTQVSTASKEKILLMLYEGAIKFSKKAKIALQNNDVADKGIMLGRAMDIIFELKNTLDFEVGGELAIQLEQLYMFMVDELTNANLNNDEAAVQNVIEILENLYSGWREAIVKEQAAKQNPSKATP
jgi:flagellar protein FliS